ncbi:MAG: NAD(P)/FAD-dependent oxidoreductase [Cyclobacteriaceae bacterium]
MREKIVITGAGLVGSLLSIFLAKRGHQVHIYEKRRDLRTGQVGGGRSINLALSDRGLKALDLVGLKQKALDQVIPMKGRMIHDMDGNLDLQPYGNKGQVINSISREKLNILLMNEAEMNGVLLHFNYKCEEAVLHERKLVLVSPNGEKEKIKADVFIGADGAFSALRGSLQKTDRFNYSQDYLEHGYKELSIPPVNGDFAMDPNALHIWPRKSFMLIALPNLDKTFTCTLFFPFEGSPSFSELDNDKKIRAFFGETFPDAVPLMPDLLKQYNENPTSSLVTVRCYPWVNDRFLLIGDASHAIVPFYGQGMNAGFEDCTVLSEIIDTNEGDWDKILSEFQEVRKKDADAIASLALRNFIEMRDKVADENFLSRKKIEKELHAKYGDRWLPLYSMVTFSDMPYSEALRRAYIQDEIMAEMKGASLNELMESYEGMVS